MTLQEWLSSHKLDHKRYEIIGSAKVRGSWIVIQRSKPPEKMHYCVQYAGSGHYFSTMEELNQYTQKRWNKNFSDDKIS